MYVDEGTIDIKKGLWTNKVKIDWNCHYYYYYINNSITRIEEKDDYPEIGFKRYIHTPDWSDDYVYKINSIVYGDAVQTGFIGDLSIYNHLEVYYLACDENNTTPLLIKLCKVDSAGKEEKEGDYYKIKEENLWDKIPETACKKNSELLHEIVENLVSYPLTLSLSSTKDYYINGSLDGPAWLPKVTVVDESPYFSFKCFRKFRHLIQDHRMNIEYIKHGDKYQCLKGTNVFSKEHDIKVYYWVNDKKFENPLMIAFDYINYVPGNGDRWEPDLTARGEILDALDRANCRKNDAHLLDITKKSNYPCSSCNSKTIRVNKHHYSSGSSSYTEYTFSVDGGIIGRISEHGTDQFITAFNHDITEISAYYFNGTVALLKIVSSCKNRWYKQNSQTGNRWKRLTRNLPTEGYDYSILTVLENVRNEDLGAVEDLEMQSLDAYEYEEAEVCKHHTLHSKVIVAAAISVVVLLYAASKCYLLFENPLRDVAFRGVHVIKRLMR
ncbi:hypothetical protein BEWA_049670 [Theileria equi strain WA]|uniref:Uncharacterized protein n=1 Tax=Theileria equi strain WA TaxID=1537102 RepID=L1LB47_THEEQ|nr:hypothetical protein BEWA_049670 [Theileria equi strain WA]EKX72500.1 hypothetical protein BEWA_049670 [Theileria equi strain WA]|eukprot:XP_004831952.1 hypothetical protein BEWA_049670 [Theileria equi strain WA]